MSGIAPRDPTDQDDAEYPPSTGSPYTTGPQLHRLLDEHDLPSINRRRARRGLRPLAPEELAERWQVEPGKYRAKVHELNERP